ncbi:hypothetical protein ACHAXT_004200 [Thalassiosira profunda]
MSSWRLQPPDVTCTVLADDETEFDVISRLKPWRAVNDAAAGPPARSFLLYIPQALCGSLFDAAAVASGPYWLQDGEQHRLPEDYPGLRMLLALHGFTGRPMQEIRKWRAAATSLNAVILAPEGSGSGGELGWNANDCCGEPVTNGVDDVDFATGVVEEALTQLQKGTRFKSAHVIATGFSNGGFLASLLGLMPAEKRPSWLVGIVPTGGYQYDVELYSGPNPLPLMMHHGGGDAVVRPGGCCAKTENASESNCVLDIGLKQQSCTSVQTAFDLWHRINGCTSPDISEDTEYSKERKIHKKDTPLAQSTVTCQKGGGCAESTVYCNWHDEGHAWGYQFAGSDMTRKWMEDVFSQAEEAAKAAAAQRRSDRGRYSFVAATISLLVLAAMLVFKKPRFCRRGKKRKSSEDLSIEDESDHITLVVA